MGDLLAVDSLSRPGKNLPDAPALGSLRFLVNDPNSSGALLRKMPRPSLPRPLVNDPNSSGALLRKMTRSQNSSHGVSGFSFRNDLQGQEISSIYSRRVGVRIVVGVVGKVPTAVSFRVGDGDDRINKPTHHGRHVLHLS